MYPLLHAIFFYLAILCLSFQITVYNINEKNNLDLDLAILSALLKGEMLFNTVIQKRQRTKIE